MADVMFGGGVESLLAYEDYFMPCDAPRDAMLAECRFENHRFVAFSRLPLAIIYNPRAGEPSAPPALQICWMTVCAGRLRSPIPPYPVRASPCWLR